MARRYLRKLADPLLGRLGYRRVDARILPASVTLPPDFDAETAATVEAVRPYTLTSPERIFALCEAVRYVIRAGIDGAFVECGVWRGGSSLAIVRTLMSLGVTDRDLYLYDTFEGMPAPGPHDVDFRGVAAGADHTVQPGAEDTSDFALLPLDEVKTLFSRSGYAEEHLHFVPGLVEETVPDHAPERIALLRLDTDYYQSTAHELTHLAPRIPDGGVLVIDDYGHFRGCRQAVDEYVARLGAEGRHLYLHRIDYTGRLAVIPHQGGAER